MSKKQVRIWLEARLTEFRHAERWRVKWDEGKEKIEEIIWGWGRA